MARFEDVVRKYHSRLKKDFQLNDVQACGIWGNLGAETGGFVHFQELKPVVKGSRGGYGWLQWTGPRRKKFEAWAKAKGLDITKDETNYLYFVHETLTDEWKSVQQVRKTTTIEAATETFMLLNLRPGVRHLDSRVRWAKRAQEAIKAKPGAVEAAIVAGGAVIAGTAAYAPTNYLPHIFIGLGIAAVIGAIIWYFTREK